MKTGLKTKVRKDKKDSHSTQFDLIIYNSDDYPLFQRFGNCVIFQFEKCPKQSPLEYVDTLRNFWNKQRYDE